MRNAVLLLLAAIAPAIAQTNPTVITLERTACFGPCPAFVLQIESSGAVSFTRRPSHAATFPRVSDDRQISRITPEQFQDLIADFKAIHFFDLRDDYGQAEDASTTIVGLTLDGKTKRISYSFGAPGELTDLVSKIERTVNLDVLLRQ